jgi:hypothetical protein
VVKKAIAAHGVPQRLLSDNGVTTPCASSSRAHPGNPAAPTQSPLHLLQH